MKTSLLILAACLVAFFSTVGAALPYPILPPLFAADAANDFNHFLGLPPKLLFGLALTINPIGLLIGSALLGLCLTAMAAVPCCWARRWARAWGMR